MLILRKCVHCGLYAANTDGWLTNICQYNTSKANLSTRNEREERKVVWSRITFSTMCPFCPYRRQNGRACAVVTPPRLVKRIADRSLATNHVPNSVQCVQQWFPKYVKWVRTCTRAGIPPPPPHTQCLVGRRHGDSFAKRNRTPN